METTIELTGGYIDDKNVKHTRVTFGREATGKDLFTIDADPQSEVPTQYALMLARMGITAFGLLKIPISLKVLLSLDGADIDDLLAGYDTFLDQARSDRSTESLSDSKVKIPSGYEESGTVYNVVEFGKRVNGYDMVAADRKGMKSALRRECFLVGREIVKLSTEDGSAQIDGPVDLDVFERLSGDDIIAIRTANTVWRDSFRNSRRGIQRQSRDGSAAVGA